MFLLRRFIHLPLLRLVWFLGADSRKSNEHRPAIQSFVFISFSISLACKAAFVVVAIAACAMVLRF